MYFPALTPKPDETSPQMSRPVSISELYEALEGRRGGDVPAQSEMISWVLSYASGAEQQIAEQQARIAHLETLYETDELTGVMNRRGFMRALNRTLAMAKRSQEAGLVAYLDLDGFKQINDTYGHCAGDKMLQAVSAYLSQECRCTDYVARMGGDEFALILADSDPIAARGRVLELQKGIEALVVPFEGHELRLGVSIGLKPYGPASCAQTLMREADRAMYRVKAARKKS